MLPTAIDATKEAVTERLTPTLESLEKNVRNARRQIQQTRLAAEDFAAGAALKVRRRPLVSLGMAGVVGALAGCVIGFCMARRARMARSTQVRDE